MNNTLQNNAVDSKLEAMENRFKLTLENEMKSQTGKELALEMSESVPLEFKDLKASLPGQIVVSTHAASDGVTGKVLFALTREHASTLADILLSGSGEANFAAEEHLEPLNRLFQSTIKQFASDLRAEIGKPVAFDDSRTVQMDLTPQDFAGAAWLVTKFDIDLGQGITVFRILSKEFVVSCFPEEHTGSTADTLSSSGNIDDAVQREMGLVLDIELGISIELGRTSMLIRDIVTLGPGSIVELDKLSGEPVDILVNGRRFAKGEVVVVDENFAVRVTELASIEERVRASRN